MTTKQNIKAIIYDRKGRILSIGENSYEKSHTLMAHHSKKVGLPHKIFLHAEVAAIVKCKDLSKAYKISVFRYNNQGKTLLAKPCICCQSALAATPIKIIEHT